MKPCGTYQSCQPKKTRESSTKCSVSSPTAGCTSCMSSSTGQRQCQLQHQRSIRSCCKIHASLFHIPSDLVVDHWTSHGDSSSHRDVLLLHVVWTTLQRLSGRKITSKISMT